MFKDILVGQYLPGDSPIHRMNPALEIILVLLYMTMLFVIKKPVSYAVFTLYTVLLLAISKVPLKSAVKGIKPLRWILVFMALFNLFLVKGEPLFSITSAVYVSKEGVYMTAIVILRLVLLVTGASIFTLTTPPLAMTDGVETLLKPFEKIKLPSRDIAMMMSISIRFIPVLAEEADKIMKAQTARGVDFSSGGIVRRAKAMLPVLIPLFVNAFRRADELALAMEARCYGAGERTKMKEQKITAADIKNTAVFIAAAVILVLTEILVEI